MKGIHRTGSGKLFYKIGEVAQITGLETHVIRFWEEAFEQLSPRKNRAGHRIFETADIELLSRIKRLVHDEGYTLDGARKRLANRNQGHLVLVDGRAGQRLSGEDLQDEISEIRALLVAARNILDSQN